MLHCHSSTVCLCREDEDFDPFLPRPPPPPPPHPLPNSRDKNGWQRYCLGAPQPQQQQQQQPNTVADADAPAHTPQLDHDGLVSSIRVTAQSSMDEATQQTPDAAEATITEPMLGMDGDAPDAKANGMSDDAADTVPGVEGGAEEMETNSMSAESEVEPGTLDETQAAVAAGHPPQMAVLASLDQVSMPL